MHWNFMAEVVSLFFLGVILLNTRKYRYRQSIKNGYFTLLVRYAFVAVVFSILTVYYSENHRLIHSDLLKLLISAFYLTYALLAYFIYIYSMAVIEENKGTRIGRKAKIALIPYALFALMVFSNFFIPWLFTVDHMDGYVPLWGEIMIFIQAYVYFLGITIKVVRNRKTLNPGYQKILMGYIVIVTTAITIQKLNPSLVLTGTGITLAILNIHLYIQSREIITDPLTQLPNRKAFMDDLRTLSFANTKAQLILISLKDFKLVNELYGQHFGDRILVELAQLLSQAELGQVYRFSGDIFAIVSLSSPQATLNVLKGLLTRILDPWTIEGVGTKLGTHTVVVEFNQHVYDHEEAFALLEYFLAKLKSERNQDLILSDEQSINQMHRQFKIIESLKTAIQEDRFTLAIQPVYHCQSQRYRSAEALLRLQDPDLGAISPAEFIPLAETSGRMPQVGLHVTELACRFLKRAQTEGIDPLVLSINYSNSQMNDPHLPTQVEAILKRHDLPGSCLRIELTESVFDYEISQVMTNMEAIRAMGLYFYMDDFGTGYSNLSRITRLPFELVKLDRSMVLHASTQDKGYELGKGLVQTFHAMGMKTIAEGIETLDQKQLVESLGIDAIQGYYFCRPMSCDEAITFFKTN